MDKKEEFIKLTLAVMMAPESLCCVKAFKRLRFWVVIFRSNGANPCKSKNRGNLCKRKKQVSGSWQSRLLY